MSTIDTHISDHYGLSKIGKVRASNEDVILLDPAKKLYLLADGMGGHLGGEVASEMAVNHIHKSLSELTPEKPIPKAIEDAFIQANTLIKKKADADKNLKGMGTTTISVLFIHNTLYIGHVGDSRLYLFIPRLPALYQITRDHSVVVEAHLDESSPEGKGYRHVLTRSVGFSEQLRVDVLHYDPKPEDQILICSDGLSGQIDAARIENIFEKSNTCKDSVESFIEAAYDCGAEDNVSVIVIKFN